MKYLLILVLFSVFVGCNSSIVYEQNIALNAEGWAISDTVTFPFDVADDQQFYDLYINFRNDNAYPYRNLYLFVKIIAPNNKYSIDTVQCLLADKEGKWMGKSAGHLWNNVILYKENIRFPMPGPYKIQYVQGMRQDVLPSITDAGFRLEQHPQSNE